MVHAKYYYSVGNYEPYLEVHSYTTACKNSAAKL